MSIPQEAAFWTIIFAVIGFLILQISKDNANKK